MSSDYYLVAWSKNHIKVYDIISGECVSTYTKQKWGFLWIVNFSTDNKNIISYSGNDIHIWGKLNGNTVAGPIPCIECKVYGDILCIFNRRNICTYDVNTGELIAKHELSFNLDTTLFYWLVEIVDNTLILVLDGFVQIFDIKSLQLLRKFSVKWYVKNRKIFNNMLICLECLKLIIYNLSTGEEIYIHEFIQEKYLTMSVDHNESIVSVYVHTYTHDDIKYVLNLKTLILADIRSIVGIDAITYSNYILNVLKGENKLVKIDINTGETMATFDGTFMYSFDDIIITEINSHLNIYNINSAELMYIIKLLYPSCYIDHKNTTLIVHNYDSSTTYIQIYQLTQTGLRTKAAIRI